MSTKYYIDNEGDLWCVKNNKLFVMLRNKIRENWPMYMKWHSFNQISSTEKLMVEYKFRELKNEELFVELL